MFYLFYFAQYVQSDSCPNLNNQTFTGISNFEIQGCENNFLQIKDSIFIKLTSDHIGGAIFLKDGSYTFELTQSSFISCGTEHSTGAVYSFAHNNTFHYLCFSFCYAGTDQSCHIVTAPDGIIDCKFITLYALGNREDPSHNQVSSFTTASNGTHTICNFNNTASVIKYQGAGIFISNCQNLISSENTFANCSGSNIIYYGYYVPTTTNGWGENTMRRVNVYQNTATGVGLIYFNHNMNIDQFVFLKNDAYPYIGCEPHKYPDAYLTIYNSKFDIDSAAIREDNIQIQSDCEFGKNPSIYNFSGYKGVCPDNLETLPIISKSGKMTKTQIGVISTISVICFLGILAAVNLGIKSKYQTEEEPINSQSESYNNIE